MGTMAQPKYTVIGLGNPGQKYADSRHNVGFMVLDALAQRLGLEWQFKPKIEVEVAKGGDWLLIKPQGYMNHSGRGARAALDFYGMALPAKESPGRLWVVYDDLDLELGQVKDSWARGPKDHRGLNSLVGQLGSELFWQLRLGIDARQVDRTVPPEQYVLQAFPAEERHRLDPVIKQVVRRVMSASDPRRRADRQAGKRTGDPAVGRGVGRGTSDRSGRGTSDRSGRGASDRGTTRPRPGQAGFQSLGDVLSQHGLVDTGGYISQEFQDFGYRLAVELGDLKHKSLYIKLAKEEDRRLLENALSFVKDAGADSPAKLFMWKLKQLRQQRQPSVDQ